MNLIELFDSLTSPKSGKRKEFSAIQIPDYPEFRIASDDEGNPALLLPAILTKDSSSTKNFRLKHLQFEQNKNCKITEGKKTSYQSFSILTFTNSDSSLQEYFLQFSEILIKSLKSGSAQNQISETLNRFIEVFQNLTATPTKTVQGLWSEIFLISNSSNPKILLDYWHNVPEEKFDFNSGNEVIEVKSSSSLERIHTFSSKQLTPQLGIKVLIASVFVKQSPTGVTIKEMANDITGKVNENFDLVEKLNRVIFKTLGNSLEQSIDIKFDYSIAKDSLKYYKQEDVIKIEEVNIPQEVSEVRYRTDLSSIEPAKISFLKPKKKLFTGI